jgi:hypothetical protein
LDIKLYLVAEELRQWPGEKIEDYTEERNNCQYF